MKQNRYKKLIYNSGLFFVASFGSKFLSFLLVRFYTEMLSPADYGIIDIITTTNNLCYGMFTLAMADAIIRFAIDLPEEQNQILSTLHSIFSYAKIQRNNKKGKTNGNRGFQKTY